MDINGQKPIRTKTYLISFNIGLFDENDPIEDCRHYPSDLYENYDACDQAFMNNKSKGSVFEL